MFHLIYDPNDSISMFMLGEVTNGINGQVYNWFNCTCINESLQNPQIIRDIPEFIERAGWHILHTFPSKPSIAELTTYIYSRPELLI